jgi:Predicted membrane protein
MLISTVRTIILYIVIVAALRLMGKRQIGQLQTSELVVTLLISEIAVMPIQSRNEPLMNGLVPILALVLFEIITAFLMLKSGKIRRVVCGKPIVVIEKGVLNQKAMRQLRMTTEDLSEQLRQKEAFFLEEVEYAIVETNGTMSVIKKTEEEPATPAQMGIKVQEKGIEVVAVTDGEISESSIKVIDKTADWVVSILKQNRKTAKDVFIMTADTNGNYKIVPKEK